MGRVRSLSTEELPLHVWANGHSCYFPEVLPQVVLCRCNLLKCQVLVFAWRSLHAAIWILKIVTAWEVRLALASAEVTAQNVSASQDAEVCMPCLPVLCSPSRLRVARKKFITDRVVRH